MKGANKRCETQNRNNPTAYFIMEEFKGLSHVKSTIPVDVNWIKKEVEYFDDGIFSFLKYEKYGVN